MQARMYGGKVLAMNYGGMVPKYMAAGGRVGSDSVPAMLTPGEFVMNKAATKRFGPMLESINPETLETTSGVIKVGCRIRCGSIYARTYASQDWWLTSKEAVADGFADEILAAPVEVEGIKRSAVARAKAKGKTAPKAAPKAATRTRKPAASK